MNGEAVRVRVCAKVQKDLEEPTLGVLIRNRLGIDVWGTNTKIEGIQLGNWKSGETIEIEFGFDCLLARGEYTLTVASQYCDGASQDWIDDAITLTVIDDKEVAGMIHWPARIDWRRG